MADHITQMGTLLATFVAPATISVFPAEKKPEGFYLQPNPKQAVHENQETEFFFLIIYGTSLANLETSITTFMNATSRRPSGYKFATPTYPSYIDVVKTNKKHKHIEFVGVLEIEGRWPL